jgi:hypothetical protein
MRMKKQNWKELDPKIWVIWKTYHKEQEIEDGRMEESKLCKKV